MKCNFCESDIPTDSIFCKECGIPIKEDVAEKEKLWIQFSSKVAMNAVPQAIEEHGDLEHDETLEEISVLTLTQKTIDQLTSIYNKCGKRGTTLSELSLFHIAHFVALIHFKIFEEEEE